VVGRTSYNWQMDLCHKICLRALIRMNGYVFQHDILVSSDNTEIQCFYCPVPTVEWIQLIPYYNYRFDNSLVDCCTILIYASAFSALTVGWASGQLPGL